MKLFGLVGYPLGHSFSKKYFTEKFEQMGLKDHSYELFEIERVEMFPGIWEKYPNLIGLNVTVPHKQGVKEYLDKLDTSAEKVGAVNVVKRVGEQLIGYNSDYYGFMGSLENFISKKAVDSALILGTGGSSKAVKAVLDDMEIKSVFVSRTAREGVLIYDELDKKTISNYQLIVNTTPIGMYPKVDHSPQLPYDALGADHYLFDLVYNPEETQFMSKGLTRGAKVKNGLEMLHKQADKSWEIWNS